MKSILKFNSLFAILLLLLLQEKKKLAEYDACNTLKILCKMSKQFK